MWIEQVPDNYPTMVVRKKKTHTKKNTRRSDGREKGAGMGGYRIRVVQENITAPLVPIGCTCTWRPVSYRPGAAWMLKFRNGACPVWREHG